MMPNIVAHLVFVLNQTLAAAYVAHGAGSPPGLSYRHASFENYKHNHVARAIGTVAFSSRADLNLQLPLSHQKNIGSLATRPQI